jgi:polysaccharide export outer membrane protein
MTRIWVALALLTWMFAGAYAQQASTPYRLGPEDVISIRVYGQADMSIDAIVSLDGTISYPFLGFIKVEGLTTADLEVLLTSRLKPDYFKDPKVSVNIVRFRPRKASVVGIVQRPGEYDFRPGDRIRSLIAQAGGPVPRSSDLKHATLSRKGSRELIPLDLETLLEGHDTSQDYELQDGDVITILEAEPPRVNVLGYVARPGQFVWTKGMMLSDAIALANGPIQDRSKLSEVVIQRPVEGRPFEYRRIVVNFVRFQEKNDYSQNIELMSGDLVYVPSTRNPDLGRANAIANIAFTISSLLSRNFGFLPRF